MLLHFFLKSVPKTTILKNGAIHFKKKRTNFGYILAVFKKKWAKIEIFHENSIITKNENFAKITVRRCTLKI